MRAVGAFPLLAFLIAPAFALDTATPVTEVLWGAKDTITLTVAIIGAVTGVLGAVLGGLNTWNSISARRLRVLVQPAHAVQRGDGGGEKAFSIAVVNLSTFPVYVQEIGFLAGPKRRAKRFAIQQHAFAACQPPPYRLEPRDSVSFYFHPYRLFAVGTELGCAYAVLASGEVITGTSLALIELQNEMAERKGISRWRRALVAMQPHFGIGRR